MLTVLIVILIGVALAPLSCLMLWGRHINFADSLIHSCTFGALIHEVFHIDIGLSIMLSGFLVWAISIFIQEKQSRDNHNILYLTSMFMSSVSIATNTNYINILFGNILFISSKDILFILLIIALIFIYIFIFKNQIIMININPILAKNNNIKVKVIQNATILLIIMSVSFFVKIMGGGFFIIAAMMLPGMMALRCSKDPVQMLKISCLAALVNSSLAVFISEYFDIAFAPLNIIVGFVIYSATVLLNKSRLTN